MINLHIKLSKNIITYFYLCKYYIGDENSKFSIQHLKLICQNSLSYKVQNIITKIR